MNPLVSLVVTTKNEERNIKTCLESLKLQTYAPVEVVVVDNGSSDRTKEMARQYTPLVFDKGPERSAQRNYGMADVAKGEIVGFVDADMILTPHLIENVVREFADPKVVALHIPEIVLGRKYFSRVRRFERTFYDGTVIDGARFFRKVAFIAIGGFDLGLWGAEDWDIDKRMKSRGKIRVLNCAEPPRHSPWAKHFESFLTERGVHPSDYGAVIYHNESEFDLGLYLKKKGYYSQSFAKYIEKWGAQDSDVRKQLGAFYRFFGVFVENGRWVRLIARPDLTFGMYFLRLCVGVRYLMTRLKQFKANP